MNAAGDVGINGTLSRGLDYNVYGPSVFPSGYVYSELILPFWQRSPIPRQVLGARENFYPQDSSRNSVYYLK